ncbi:MAG: hypothetical protein CL508_05235 [Actinobacteria bacterium]|nr:hypothetical protein [Actinomycetota bacterium]MBO71701.1 hypothetical protein [Actinomycetota bacterium]|tara:strand:+ start:25247 stop:25588 length:342 start_codon:yes stop_codon:yes gene_type:complete
MYSDDEIDLIVSNPVLHRANDREYAEKMRKQNEDSGVIYIDTLLDTGLTDDFWICDMCNDQINVVDEQGESISVYLWLQTRALCGNCIDKYEEQGYLNEGKMFCPCCIGKEKV